jgi:hypothetical protein
LLARLKVHGNPSKLVSTVQEQVGASLARRDFQKANGEKPWDLRSSYAGKDKWYKPFNRAYRQAWLKAGNWKLADWPLFWRK